jgi:ferredoxin-NADP reductase
VDRTILEIIDETPDVKTFRLDNSDGTLPFDLPGKFVKVCVPIDGKEIWRSFTVSSSPARPETIDLTIKLNPIGEVSRYLFETAIVGSKLRIKGTQGGFFFDPERHTEPLLLISAGSGITPMMSIARFIADRGIARECLFLHGARSASDIIFAEHCAALAVKSPWLKYVVTLSQPSESWTGRRGRVTAECIVEHMPDVARSRAFLCGPNDFMDSLREQLLATGIPADRIHTEQFQKSPLRAISREQDAGPHA